MPCNGTPRGATLGPPTRCCSAAPSALPGAVPRAAAAATADADALRGARIAAGPGARMAGAGPGLGWAWGMLEVGAGAKEMRDGTG